MKNIIITAVVIAILFTVISAIFWGNSREKIRNAESNMKTYQQKYDKIRKTDDSLDVIVQTLNAQRTRLDHRADSMKNQIVILEQQGEQDVIRIARLFEPDEIVEEVKTVFPKFRNAPMGIAELTHPRTHLPITTFQMPVQLVSSFIADRKQVQNLLAQKQEFQKVNLTLEEVIALQDSIVVLKNQTIIAYKEGLDYGLERYEALTKEYISTLKNPPKISLLPNKPFAWMVVAAGSAVAGYKLAK